MPLVANRQIMLVIHLSQIQYSENILMTVNHPLELTTLIQTFHLQKVYNKFHFKELFGIPTLI